jgi:hypothetical protein
LEEKNEKINKISNFFSSTESTSTSENLIFSTDNKDYKLLATWFEDLIVKVLYGELRLTPTIAIEMVKMFSNLYKFLAAGEMSG